MVFVSVADTVVGCDAFEGRAKSFGCRRVVDMFECELCVEYRGVCSKIEKD